MRLVLIALSALTVGGCTEPEYKYAGFRTYDYFPLDGTRTWKYKHAVHDYLLEVDMETEPEVEGATRIHTLRYKQDEPSRVLYAIKWSSDSTDGVQIHGYIVENEPAEVSEDGDDTGEPSGGDDTASTAVDTITDGWVDFDPPLQLTEYQMAPGDVLKSSAGGDDYTSTFEETESCPNDWRDDWECLRLVIESSSSDPAPFVGTWHWATEYGTSLFEPVGEAAPWTLVEATWFAS